MPQQDDDIKEIQRIQSLDNNNLLTEFEGLIRRGAGSYYHQFNWFKKEIMKRMDAGKVGKL